jgi:hypothetical protein
MAKTISIFSNGGHLGYRTALTDTILKGDHLRIISAKFGWNWLSSFREDFFLISSPLFSNLHNRSKYVKIYIPCNFEVNLITHLGVIALFSSIFFFILILFVLYFKNYLEIDVKFNLQKCAACQDLPTLKSIKI